VGNGVVGSRDVSSGKGAAEVICVGTELLLGDILNGNARYLAQELAALGIPHYYQTVVGDNPDRIRRALAIACERSRLILFTGGLGPTPDDLTTEAIADFFNTSLVEWPSVVESIRQKYASIGVTPTDSSFKQALQPQGAALLPNNSGTAPGMIWEARPGLVLMTFPGVPREMRGMWRETAVPWLQQRGWSSGTFASRTLKFHGIGESTLAEQVASYFEQANPTVAPYAGDGEVRLRVTARAETAAEAEALIGPTAEALKDIGGQHYFGADGQTLATVVGELLLNRGETLAVAESCTGGGLGQRLTAVPGSSAYFCGGVISYDNSVKQNLLGVEAGVLETQGAVSAIVAEQMARGVRAALKTSWGIGITGIAGPGGGSTEKPVGLVYIGLAGPDGSVKATKCLFGQRERSVIRDRAALEALNLLRLALADQ